jgi:hypothetical protein
MVLIALPGCSAPSARLTFPERPTSQNSRGIFYNVHHHSAPDFALLKDDSGRIDSVAYDDAGDGHFNRVYRLSDYRNEDVPHLIVLLDSIPYWAVADRWGRGEFRCFDRPQKVIPVFPSLTELCFSRLLGAPPLPGIVDDYYDRDSMITRNAFWDRVMGHYREPWERRLHYAASGYESGLTYLRPREWFAAELARAKKAFDDSPDRVTLVYFVSASAMVSRFGRAGLDEVLDGANRLCTQVLYERQGAVKITMMADHGHNLMATKNISLEPALRTAGFNPTNQLMQPKDVVLELQGLVTYIGIRTNRPAEVARAVLACPQVELAFYMDGPAVIVRNKHGSAAVECRDHKTRYRSIDADPLDYQPVIAALRAGGKCDTDGYVSDDDWLAATVDHPYPDAPRRLWDALHGTVWHPPEVMITTRDGWCAGRKNIEFFIKMASTHGSLNQINSATFVMTMTGRAKGPMRTKDIMGTIEPGYVPLVR